jgi:DNA-binding transcriptional MerR regulator
MFSIGEFARLGGVSVRTLRHYDEIGLLRPARVDQDTGYRGYTADQLGQLNRVMALKELGLSLTQARRLLDGITLDELNGMLILRRAQLEHELPEHQNQLLGIEARLRHIAREGARPPGRGLAMRPAEQLAAERARGNLQLAERLRYGRRLRTLRRARRMELRAETASWRSGTRPSASR